MKKQLTEFFEANPEATEVHVALGYLHNTSDEAMATLAGVSDQAVKTYTREQVEGLRDDEENEAPADVLDHKLVQTFKKLPVDKMPKVMEQQEALVTKLEASLMATDNKVKAEKAIAFHKSILEAMREAFKEKSSQ
jgi:predicted transcriptional regulator